jgi:hypothetical protein
MKALPSKVSKYKERETGADQGQFISVKAYDQEEPSMLRRDIQTWLRWGRA